MHSPTVSGVWLLALVHSHWHSSAVTQLKFLSALLDCGSRVTRAQKRAKRLTGQRRVQPRSQGFCYLQGKKPGNEVEESENRTSNCIETSPQNWFIQWKLLGRRGCHILWKHYCGRISRYSQTRCRLVVGRGCVSIVHQTSYYHELWVMFFRAKKICLKLILSRAIYQRAEKLMVLLQG